MPAENLQVAATGSTGHRQNSGMPWNLTWSGGAQQAQQSPALAQAAQVPARTCIMSPAWLAPASAMAPATKLGSTCRGAITANTTCACRQDEPL